MDDEPLILPIPLCTSSLRALWREYYSDSPTVARWSHYRPKLERWWRDLFISIQPDPPRQYPDVLYRWGIMKKVKVELQPADVAVLALSDAITPHRNPTPDDKKIKVEKVRHKKRRFNPLELLYGGAIARLPDTFDLNKYATS